MSESLPDLERQQVCPKSVGSKVTWNGARTDFPEPIAYTFCVPWLQNFYPWAGSLLVIFSLTRIRRQPVKKEGTDLRKRLLGGLTQFRFLLAQRKWKVTISRHRPWPRLLPSSI